MDFWVCQELGFSEEEFLGELSFELKTNWIKALRNGIDVGNRVNSTISEAWAWLKVCCSDSYEENQYKKYQGGREMAMDPEFSCRWSFGITDKAKSDLPSGYISRANTL